MKNVLHTFLSSLLQAVLIVSLLSFTSVQRASIDARLSSVENAIDAQQQKLGLQQEQLSNLQFTMERRLSLLHEQGIKQ